MCSIQCSALKTLMNTELHVNSFSFEKGLSRIMLADNKKEEKVVTYVMLNTNSNKKNCQKCIVCKHVILHTMFIVSIVKLIFTVLELLNVWKVYGISFLHSIEINAHFYVRHKS